MNTLGHPSACRRGMCWLLYEYVTRGLTKDFWFVLKKEWADTEEFGG